MNYLLPFWKSLRRYQFLLWWCAVWKSLLAPSACPLSRVPAVRVLNRRRRNCGSLTRTIVRMDPYREAVVGLFGWPCSSRVGFFVFHSCRTRLPPEFRWNRLSWWSFAMKFYWKKNSKFLEKNNVTINILPCSRWRCRGCACSWRRHGIDFRKILEI